LALRSGQRISEITYVGCYDADYARHRILQAGLRELGIAITETRNQSVLPVRWVRLSVAVLRARQDVPVLFGESSNYLLPTLVVAQLARRHVTFDTFVSLKDTYADRHEGVATRPLVWLGGVLDRLNCGSSNRVIVDTEANRRYFRLELGVPSEKLGVVPVGAETELFRRTSSPASAGVLHVLFYGTFIPLHGIGVILRAAKILQDARARIRFQIVGDGQEYARMKRTAESLRVHNVRFGPRRVPYVALPSLIESSDVVLGIFADRPKTRRVIPHKVFQAAACGRAIVSADTPAIREAFSDDSAVLVPPDRPAALADALSALADDPERRRLLGERAADIVHRRYSPSAVARDLLAFL
jgi:glycosyltransferase involved in cell wall biosynthesis